VEEDARPTLKAVILDFSSVNNVDITSVQNLIDVRNQLDKYASPDVVQWHFASVNNRWTKRALAAAGFGYPAVDGARRWKPIFSVAEIGGNDSAAHAAHMEELRREATQNNDDVENGVAKRHGAISQAKVALVHGVNLPLFHVDLTSALQSAIQAAERPSRLNADGTGAVDGTETPASDSTLAK
jgi:sodium-independent sulfate anion transporter 11